MATILCLSSAVSWPAWVSKSVSGLTMPSLLGTGPGVHYKSLKTVNQSLKYKVNRCVLSLRLNECKLSASGTAAGRLFHTTGPVNMPSLFRLSVHLSLHCGVKTTSHVKQSDFAKCRWHYKLGHQKNSRNVKVAVFGRTRKPCKAWDIRNHNIQKNSTILNEKSKCV